MEFVVEGKVLGIREMRNKKGEIYMYELDLYDNENSIFNKVKLFKNMYEKYQKEGKKGEIKGIVTVKNGRGNVDCILTRIM